MKYVLGVSYDGTDFSGWQIQKNGRTVQGVLEQAAFEIFRKEIKIKGSGRTDAGVHAHFQVCEFEAETSVPAEKIRECFNRILPTDVSVLKSAAAPEGFDCTRAARKKTYCYRAYYAEYPLPLFERYEARLKNKIDTQRMRKAAELLIGRHDFKAFSATGSSAKTSEREIYSIVIRENAEGRGAVHYEIEVCGNGFLYNMVRIIAGELFGIGSGKGDGAIKKALETGKRELLAKTMPAKGLALLNTEYGINLFENE